jgi:hypothetical protein
MLPDTAAAPVHSGVNTFPAPERAIREFMRTGTRPALENARAAWLESRPAGGNAALFFTER